MRVLAARCALAIALAAFADRFGGSSGLHIGILPVATTQDFANLTVAGRNRSTRPDRITISIIHASENPRHPRTVRRA